MSKFLDFRRDLGKELLKYSSKKVHLKKGEILFLDNFLDEKIAILTDGMINYNTSIQTVRELSLGCYSSNAILFLSSMFEEYSLEKQEISSYNISASFDSTIEFVSIDTFKDVIYKDEELMYKLYKFYGLFHEKNFYQLRDLQIFKTEDAILSILLRAYNTYGVKIDDYHVIKKKIFNTNIAKCLDITEETVSRTISNLRKKNILSKKDGFIIINDLDYVKEKLGCKYCNEKLCYL